MSLEPLGPRTLPSGNPFPEVPSQTLYLDSGDTVVCALAPGGPRVVRLDAAGAELWSAFVADPESRGGVDVDGVRLLLGERVVQESQSPGRPAGVDLLANAINGAFGLFEGAAVGVGLVYDTSAGETVPDWQSRLYMPQDTWSALADSGRVDPYDVYVAQGDSITRARTLPRYVEIRLEGPGPFSPAEVGRLVLAELNGVSPLRGL